jgi:CheY-like chemotaxis protein
MHDTDRKVILLVIDNPDDVTWIRRTLIQSAIGDDIVLARDGAEALEYLFGGEAARNETGNPIPAAIVLDLKLPRIDGTEVLRRVRADARTRTLPVLVFSSQGEVGNLVEKDDRKLLRSAGDFSQFREAVRELGAALTRPSAS